MSRTTSQERRLLLERLRSRRSAGPEPGVPRISLFFFSANLDDRAEDKYRLVLECARTAERVGLHAVWTPERHFDPFGAPYPNPALLLASIAAVTDRIALRAGSVVLPLHDPILIAEEWGALDAISGGRVGLALASGWHADDFVLAPDDFADRKRLLEEKLDTVLRLWRGEPVRRTGPEGRPVDVRTYPRPAAPPPLWLTSAGNPQTWERAGHLDLNVLTAMLEQTVDDIARKVTLYHKARAAAGHLARATEVTCMLHTHLAADAAQVPDRVRGPLTEYLSAHLQLYAKFAAANDIGVRLEEVRTEDRAALIEHGLRRYLETAGLFGDVRTCQPMVDRLVAAGVTEFGCLVDFGLPDEQVLECVEQLGVLQRRLRAGAGDPALTREAQH